jgi:hypothetical protein
MILRKSDTNEVLRILGETWLHLTECHKRDCPKNGAIPVGGRHMDDFFYAESVRGFMSKLRTGKCSVDECLKFGKECGKLAVGKWNESRERQVHRWENCCDAFLDSQVRMAISRLKCRSKNSGNRT